jgi:hypothetical protein
MEDVAVETRYDKLEKAVKSWGVSTPAGQYDSVGVIHLLGACLDNLRGNANEAELERITECLDEDQQLFLRKLAAYASTDSR